MVCTDVDESVLGVDVAAVSGIEKPKTPLVIRSLLKKLLILGPIDRKRRWTGQARSVFGLSNPLLPHQAYFSDVLGTDTASALTAFMASRRPHIICWDSLDLNYIAAEAVLEEYQECTRRWKKGYE